MKKILLSVLFSMLILVSVGHATWFDNNAGQRVNFTAQNVTAGITGQMAYPLSYNFTQTSNVCVDQSPVIWMLLDPNNVNGSHVYMNYSTALIRPVNNSDNEGLYFEMENNTCSQSETQTFSDRNRVWNEYAGVFHFGDNSLAHQENSRGGRVGNATVNGTAMTVAGGFWGRGVRTNDGGTESSIIEIKGGWDNQSNGLDDQNLTVYMKYKPNTTTAGARVLFSLYNDGNQCGVFIDQGTSTLRVYCLDPANTAIVDSSIPFPNSKLVLDAWNTYQFTYDGNSGSVLSNCVNILNFSGSGKRFYFGTPNQSVKLGGSAGYGGVNDAMADFDEFRYGGFNSSQERMRDECYAGALRGGVEARSPPVVFTILDPANTTYTSVARYLNVTYDTSVTVDKFWYKINGGTSVFFTPNTTFNGKQGLNVLQVFANNTAGVQSEVQVNFTESFPPPTINITAPLNITYTQNNVTLRTVFVAPFPDKFWYVLNGGANTTFNQNTTFLASEGSNFLLVVMNDSIGQTGSRNVSFTINTTQSGGGTTSVTTDPNVLLFIAVFALIMVGLFWMTR